MGATQSHKLAAEDAADELASQVARHEERLREADHDQGRLLSVDAGLTAVANGLSDLAARLERHEQRQTERDTRQERAIERLTLLCLSPLVMTGTVTAGASPTLTIASTISVVLLALIAPDLGMRLLRRRVGLESDRPPPPSPTPAARR